MTRPRRRPPRSGTQGIWKHLDTWIHRFRIVSNVCKRVKVGVNKKKCYLPVEQAGTETILERKEEVVS